VFSRLKNFLNRKSLSPDLCRLAERQLILQGTLLSKLNCSRQQLPGLYDAGFSAFSQWGEDGMIDWLIEHIPNIPGSFVEFGVGNYTEANTRFLLQRRNWHGLLIEGSTDAVAEISQQELYWQYNVTAIQAFIDCENINILLQKAGFFGKIGLLSIDIDGNDYWVWQAINIISPVIVVIEFNAIFGDIHPLTIPYQPSFQRHQAHYSYLYFGASLPALIKLASEKGYKFLGTGLFGCNAFFIHQDFADSVLPALERNWAFPTLAREARNEQNNLAFVDFWHALPIISSLPVVNLDSGEEMALSSINDLYSPIWQQGKGICI
jgi:hypothetical protein